MEIETGIVVLRTEEAELRTFSVPSSKFLTDLAAQRFPVPFQVCGSCGNAIYEGPSVRERRARHFALTLQGPESQGWLPFNWEFSKTRSSTMIPRIGGRRSRVATMPPLQANPSAVSCFKKQAFLYITRGFLNTRGRHNIRKFALGANSVSHPLKAFFRSI